MSIFQANKKLIHFFDALLSNHEGTYVQRKVDTFSIVLKASTPASLETSTTDQQLLS